LINRGISIDSASVIYRLTSPTDGRSATGRGQLMVYTTTCEVYCVAYQTQASGSRQAKGGSLGVPCGPDHLEWQVCTTVGYEIPNSGGVYNGGGSYPPGWGGGGNPSNPPWMPPAPPCPGAGGNSRVNVNEGCTPGWIPIYTFPPLPEPIDSILKRISEFANRYSDSLFNIALTQRAEYCFTIVDYNNNVMDTLHMRTDGSGMAVIPRYGVYGGRRLRGIWHAHVIDSPIPITDTSAISGPSGDDVGNLFDLLNQNPPVPVLTECGFVRYALVVENPQKANAFFRTQGNGPLLLYNKLLQMVYNDPRSSTNLFHQVSVEKLRLILGNSAISGIGIYKSSNPEKTLYTKLN
jgi:hypothetical protein